MLDEQGGFTVHLRSGERIANGVSVGTRPGRSLSFAADQWNDRVVDEWLRAAAAAPVWRSSAIGGWVDPASGTVWLDVVRVLPSPLRWLAILLGRAANQHCVFDIGRRQTVALR